MPAIVSVEILWSENGAIHARRGAFPSLKAADEAISRALLEEAPPLGGAYDKTAFRVTSDDGDTYEGRCDITGNMWRTVESGRLLALWMRQFCEYLRDTDRPYVTPERRKNARYWLSCLDAESEAA
jgi:hypothetical protein